MEDMIKVGMADLKVCPFPKSITTLGLGSCVGIALYDPTKKIGGLAHIMLPDSTKIRNSSNKAKFADTGIVLLADEMVKYGALRTRLVAKIAGGAQMFAFSNQSDMVRIGARNVESSKEILKQLGIPLLAEDTGLNFGRTVEFYTETGDFLIKSVGKTRKII